MKFRYISISYHTNSHWGFTSLLWNLNIFKVYQRISLWDWGNQKSELWKFVHFYQNKIFLIFLDEQLKFPLHVSFVARVESKMASNVVDNKWSGCQCKWKNMLDNSWRNCAWIEDLYFGLRHLPLKDLCVGATPTRIYELELDNSQQMDVIRWS